MPAFPDFDPVLRLSDVRASREEIEAALGVPLFRYEPYRKRPGTYAQVNFRSGADWNEIVAEMLRIGPALRLAVERGLILGPLLDVGIFLAEEGLPRSLVFPAQLCEALGQFGVELELSVYPFSEPGEQVAAPCGRLTRRVRRLTRRYAIRKLRSSPRAAAAKDRWHGSATVDLAIAAGA